MSDLAALNRLAATGPLHEHTRDLIARAVEAEREAREADEEVREPGRYERMAHNAAFRRNVLGRARLTVVIA